jgi:hypothetical protein
MIRKAFLFVRCASAALALACAGTAQAQVPLSEGTVMEAVERLKPGEFLWAPEIAAPDRQSRDPARRSLS